MILRPQLKNESLRRVVDEWYYRNREKVEKVFGPIGSWDVSQVTDMSGLFYKKYSFNEDIREWDVSNVKYMDSLFKDAFIFDQPIGNWNVSNVITMEGMFGAASIQF